jgi:hypothetical protein
MDNLLHLLARPLIKLLGILTPVVDRLAREDSNVSSTDAMTLSEGQLHTLAIVERSASILSILGIATIIGTFCLSRQFRNPIHRIIFINAFYNLDDVTATTISLSGPAAGNHSALCQFQGFLMQMYV